MKKIVQHPSTQEPPASGRKPGLRLTERELQASPDELVSFHQLFQTIFQRREQREWSLFYLCGQLSNLPRKTIERMVLGLRGADRNTVRVAQRFISQGTWCAERFFRVTKKSAMLLSRNICTICFRVWWTWIASTSVAAN